MKYFLIILVILFFVGIFFAHGQEQPTDADYHELVLTAKQQAIIDSMSLIYNWNDCYQGTTTCQEYKVKMSATVK